MTTGGYTPGDPPSDRVLRLLDYAFLQWNDQWFKRREFPKYPHLLNTLSSKKKEVVQGASIMIRKGWAIKVHLGHFTTPYDTGSVKVLCRTAPWAIEVAGEGGGGGKDQYRRFYFYHYEVVLETPHSKQRSRRRSSIPFTLLRF